jgi:hypothetical protein
MKLFMFPVAAGAQRGRCSTGEKQGCPAVLATLLFIFAGCLQAWCQPTAPGSAAGFSGTQYGYVNHPLILSNASFTVEWWSRRDRTNVVEFAVALGNTVPQPTNTFFRAGFRSNDTFFVSFGSNDLATASTFRDTNWHHFAVSYNTTNGARHLLADGALVANDSSLPFRAPFDKFTVAWDNVGPHFQGAMDEIRVWNSARTDTQLADNRSHPLVGNESGLIAYYRCDVVTSGSSPDATTNNHPLNLSPTPLVPSGPIFLPTVLTAAPSGVGSNSVTFNSTVNPYGSATTAWFQWGAASGVYTNETSTQSVGNGNGATSVSQALANLLAATTYYYRAAASNAAGVVFGSELSFHTSGQTLVVTNSGDSGPGTLRQIASGLADGDTITFATASPITLTSGEIFLNRSVTVRGPGAQQLAINGNANSRIFEITNAAVAISGLSITNGRANQGGGIFNGGTLTLDRCVISDCTTNGAFPWEGAAIKNIGTLVMRDCTLARNLAKWGAAIDQTAGGNASITNCSILDNVGKTVIDSLGLGSSPSMVLSHCTINGNFGDLTPIYNGGDMTTTMTIESCTIADNSTTASGVIIYNDFGISLMTLRNTILANGTATNLQNVGTFTSLGGNVSSDNSVGEVHTANALLAPIGDYGGYTPTRPPLTGSPAINTANTSNRPAFDQRGLPRLAGFSGDSGAVEYHPTYTGQFGSNQTWNTYVLVDHSDSWVGADGVSRNTLFHNRTGHLASVHSLVENDFISAMGNARAVWLGLTDNENYGGSEAGTNRVTGWVWTSGEPFTYQNWGLSEPNDLSPGQDAVYLYDKKWGSYGMGAFGQIIGTARYVIEFDTQAPAPISEVTPDKVWLPPNLRPDLSGRANLFQIVEKRSGSVNDIATAGAVLSSGGGTQGFAPVINHRDPDNFGFGGIMPGKQPFLSNVPGTDDNDVQMLAKGRIVIPAGQGGDWTFGVHSDDGFALRIVGQQWKAANGNGFIDPADSSVVTYPFGSTDTDTRGIISLAPGEYDVEFVSFEATGGAYWEFYAARGAFTNDTDTTNWRLVGAPDGLALTGSYATNNAMQFGGIDGSVTIAHQTPLNAYPLTVSTWIKTTQNDAVQRGIITKYDVGSVNGYQMLLFNGHLRAWYFRSGVGNAIWDGGDGLDGGFVADGQWHHAAFVVDASGGKIFVDGMLKTNLAWTGTAGAPTTTAPLRFARYGDSYFAGFLDEVRLWNRALTEDEIHDSTFMPPNTNDLSLVGAWRFEEPAVLDSTANGFNGTFFTGLGRVPSTIAEFIPIDSGIDSGPRSLRDAIAGAPGARLGLTGTNPVVLTSGTLNITNSVRIEGVSGRRVIKLDPGAPESSVITMSAPVQFQVENLAITGGVGDPGGGIRAWAIPNAPQTLVAVNCVFSNNLTRFFGGGVFVIGQTSAFLRGCDFIGNGKVAGFYTFGGGMLSQGGHVRLDNCTFSNNVADRGGGLNVFDGTLELVNCTFSGNQAVYGGALMKGPSQNVLNATNCTFSANQAAEGGALNIQLGSAAFVHCTVADNVTTTSGSGALYGSGANLQIQSSIFAGTHLPGGNADGDISATVNSLGNNLIQNTNGAIITNVVSGNLYGVDPLLGPLTNNGGPTLTYALLPGSPARDAGTNFPGLPLTDQRGQPRIRGAAPDIGAYEGCVQTITVTNVADNGPGSLRQSVLDVCACGTIQFATNLQGQTITLTNGQIPIVYDTIIQGPGANLLTVSGNNSSRIFQLTSARATIADLTFTGGRAGTNGSNLNQTGGAILSDSSLEIDRCAFLNNHANYAGGAIAVVPTASPAASVIRDSTFAQNSVAAGGNGNAVANGLFGGQVEQLGQLQITQCTFSDNQGPLGAGLWGGAIANLEGHLTIEQSTIAGNVADNGGGVFNYGGNVSVHNTIISGNSATTRGPDVDLLLGAEGGSGGIISLGNNFIGTQLGAASNVFLDGINGDLAGVPPKTRNALLGLLANNGGPTLTRALLPDSAARNTGGTTLAGLTTDQRGFPRQSGFAPDIGAYEGVASIQLTPAVVSGQMRLQFSGEPNFVYKILTSTNLALPLNQWVELGAAAELSPGQFQFADGITNAPGRFYRTRWP